MDLGFGFGVEAFRIEGSRGDVAVAAAGFAPAPRGVEGKVVEINSTMMVIETDHGRIMIPAKLYLEEISHVRHPVDKAVGKS